MENEEQLGRASPTSTSVDESLPSSTGLKTRNEGGVARTCKLQQPCPLTDMAKEGQAGGDLPKVTQRTGGGESQQGACGPDPPHSPVGPSEDRRGGTEGP